MEISLSDQKTLNAVGGISGDMFICSAYSANVFTSNELQVFLGASQLSGTAFKFVNKTDMGISAIQLELELDSDGGHEHTYSHNHHKLHHRHVNEVLEYAQKSSWSARQKDIFKGIFSLLAEAESRVHGIPSSSVHFHEVGSKDSIFDIAVASFIIDRLGLSNWFYHPLPQSTGTVDMTHGQYPAFAPAVRYLLTGFEFSPGATHGECITPTGAAILAFLKPEKIRNFPGGKLLKSGVGKGTRDGKVRPNVLWLDLFQAEEQGRSETSIQEICFEVDDMTPEALAHALETLRQEVSVIDVVSYPVLGKKARMAMSVRVLVVYGFADVVSHLCFDFTSTIGVRIGDISRRVLPRTLTNVAEVPVKIVERPSGQTLKPESDAFKGMNYREIEYLNAKVKDMFYDKEDSKYE